MKKAFTRLLDIFGLQIQNAKPDEKPKEDEAFSLFKIDGDLFKSEEARKALNAGLLAAKREAKKRASSLLRFGRPLEVAIVFVSFVHILEVVAGIKPDNVQTLGLADGFYHISNALWVTCVDLAALYIVASTSAAAYAGGKRHSHWVWFFLALTFALNASYVVRHAPSLEATFRTSALPFLDMIFVFLLPAVIPVGVLSVEDATRRLETARLKLIVETTALATILGVPVEDEKKSFVTKWLGKTNETPAKSSATLAKPDETPAQNSETGNTVRVTPGTFPVFSAILAQLDNDPTLDSTVLATALSKSTRLIEMRKNELVSMGVLVKNGNMYSKNGVELAELA